jgi:predicted esterase
MIRLTRRILVFTFLFIFIVALKSNAQSVINPLDPVVNYDPSHPPAIPPDNQVSKWVRTPNETVHTRNDTIIDGVVHPWNTDVYKAYIYQRISFRILFPKSYNATANDGKKYPIIIFLHGKGENAAPPLYDPNTGINYDNEYQLLQGPHEFDVANQNGTYDGYVIAAQIPDQWYRGLRLEKVMDVVKYMIANNKVDPFHIVVNGLSDGGQATWDILDMYPTYISAATPMSAPLYFVNGGQSADSTYISTKRFTPIWASQGGADVNPSPAQTQRLTDSMMKYGSNFKVTTYSFAAHQTWYQFWGERDFWPFINRAYSSNPWMLGGLKHPWPGAPFRDTIGIAPGFAGYKWRLNGVEIPGQTSNTLVVTAAGTYDAMVLRDGIWSEWSHVPITIKPGFYEAENFVSSSTSSNRVLTFPTTDAGGGEGVGWIGNGDYMDYTINPNVPGTFTLRLRVAAETGGGKIQVRSSDSTVLATIDVPQTGGWETWVTTEPVNVTLAAGIQNIRLKSIANVGWNINWLQFGLTGSQGPLPVKFVYFNSRCKGTGVDLEWKTAQEFNSKSFDVQISADGINWSKLSSIPAAGLSSSERTYHYTDNSGGTGNLYRIVQMDLDSKSTISSVVRSNCGAGQNDFKVSPNPVSGSTVLNVHLEQAAIIKWKIIDSKGALVLQNQMALPAGSSSIPLNLSNYSKGMYSINIYYNNDVRSIKLIKK